MSTDPTSGSGNIQSFLGVTVTQQYPESQLDLPWHQTIITSATTLLWGDPGPAPEIVTLVQSPPFFKDRPVAAATWELICAPDVLPAEAFERVQRKAGRLISKDRLYLDPALPKEEITRGAPPPGIRRGDTARGWATLGGPGCRTPRAPDPGLVVRRGPDGRVSRYVSLLRPEAVH